MPDTFDEFMKKRQAQPANDFDAFMQQKTQPPPQQPEGAISSFQTGLAGPLLRNVLNTAADLYNQPMQTLERAGRAGLEFVSAFDPAGAAYPATVASEEPRIQQLRAQAEAQRPEQLRSAELGLQQLEARPRTTAGKVAGKVGSILGEVAFPTAPETAVQNIALAPFAGAATNMVGKVARTLIRRLKGANPAEVESAIQQAVQDIVPTAPEPLPPTEPIPNAPVAARLPQLTPEQQAFLGDATQTLPAEANANPVVQDAITRFRAEVQRIKASNLSPEMKAGQLKAAIESMADESAGIRRIGNKAVFPRNQVGPGSEAGYPPDMVMPENPNPMQQAGILPRVFESPEAQALRETAPAPAIATPAPAAPQGRVVTVGDKQYTLTPEQEARWQTEVDEPLASAKREADRLRPSSPQRANEINRAEAMRVAAVKRQIVNALTPKEEAAIAAREVTNYRGKSVMVDVGGQPVPGTVQGMAFGRVRVQLEDGQVVSVPPASVGPRQSVSPAMEAPAQPSVLQRMAEIQRTPSSPVRLTQLRDEFPNLSKQEFDNEILRLQQQGQIALHKIDNAGSLPADELNNLVKSGDNYYIAATFKQPLPIANIEGGPPPLSVDYRQSVPATRSAQPYTETTGPRVSDVAAYNAPAPAASVNNAVQQAVDAVPRSVGQKIKDEVLGALGAVKTLRASVDISAIMRQGGLLFLRPFQYKQSQQALAKMFSAFREGNFNAINEAIAASPDAALMKEAGLHLSAPSGEGLLQGEAAFLKKNGSWIGKKAANIPLVKQSDQMYQTFLDVQRVNRFGQFKQQIDKMGLSPEEAMKGYQAAARFINYATGRGSLGKKFNGVMDGLNLFFFSPRFVASRLNILNPGMYIKNGFSGPAGRAVLRGQMSDLAQYVGTVGAIMYGAKTAGADITLNPNSPDFGKIKFGTWRYDLGAGLTQVLRTAWRIGADTPLAATKQKAVGQSAIDIGEAFLANKLSPPAGVLRDFFKRQTVNKQPFTYTRAAADLVIPMQIADFIDAFKQEGLLGLGKTAIGTTGVGVQNYAESPGNVRVNKQLSDVFLQHGLSFSSIPQVPGDTEATQKLRALRVEDWLNTYGAQLVNHPRFQQMNDAEQTSALKGFQKRITDQANQKTPNLASLNAANIISAALQNERNQPIKERRKIVPRPTP